MSDTGRSPARAGRGGTGGTVRQRRAGGGEFSPFSTWLTVDMYSPGTAASGGQRGTGSGGMWRFYTEDSQGVKIGPVPVLVMSLVFIASVFLLHIWGKFTRSS